MTEDTTRPPPAALLPETENRRRSVEGLLTRLVIRRTPALPAAAATVALVALTTLVNLPVQELTGHRAPFVPFFVCLFLAGALLGTAAGFLALALSLAAVVWLWFEPIGSLRIGSAQDLALCGFFVVAGSGAVMCAAYARRLVRRLENARQDLARALAAGTMFTWRWDAAADRFACSANAEAVLGGRWGTLRDAWSTVHPDDAPALMREAEAALESAHEFRLVGRVVRRDTGAVRWLETRGVVHRADGRAVRVLGVTTDVTERQESLLRAREQAAELQALMEATPAFVFFSRDPECRVVGGLPETYRLLGLPPGSNLSKTPDEHEAPAAFRVVDADGEDVPGASLPLQTAASTGRSVRDVSLQVRSADGRALRLLGNAEPLLDAAGRPSGAVAAFVDVTPLVQARESLRRREALYHTLAEAFPDFVWATDPAGRTLFVNRRWREYTGLSLEDVQADGWASLHHPDDLARLHEIWTRAMATPEPLEMQYRYRRHDGEFRRFWCRAVPLLDDEGRVDQWLGTSIDITDRLSAESRVARLAALVEATPDFVAVMRPGAQLTYMNRAGRRMVGVPEHADVTDWDYMRFSPDRVTERVYREWLPQAMREGSASGEGALRRLDGSEVPVSFVILVHRDLRGEVEFVSTYARDISGQQALTDHLRLESQRKDEFLATLAHELRNPMAPIRYAAELLTRSATPESVDRARSVIRRQAAQMSRLLDDLLDISRITRNLVELRRDTVDLRTVLRAAVQVAQPAMTANRHALSVSLPPEPVWVHGDETRLTQVVANLLDNAAKYTPPGGRVELIAACEGTEALVRVKDDGIGLTAEASTRVFELFAQGGTVGDAPRSGLGIGLSVVKRLAELHGGSVAAVSDGPGRGASFDVRLPLAAGQPRPAPVTTGHAGVVRLFGDVPRVLVVDDNRDAADSLSALLRVRGFQVSVAYDGDGAVAAFSATQPSIVLLDLGLPDVPGDEVARRLRAIAGGAVRFIAITGWGQPHDRERTRAAGFEEHLVKPVDPDALMAVLVAERGGAGDASAPAGRPG